MQPGYVTICSNFLLSILYSKSRFFFKGTYVEDRLGDWDCAKAGHWGSSHGLVRFDACLVDLSCTSFEDASVRVRRSYLVQCARLYLSLPLHCIPMKYSCFSCKSMEHRRSIAGSRTAAGDICDR